MIELIRKLWFKPRHLISDGYDESLMFISKILPLKILEIPTGLECWTWKIPEKWSLKNAWIKDVNGKKIFDGMEHPLNVISYSLPIKKTVTRNELLEHINSLPKKPDAIPYDYAFYEKKWGFCMEHKKKEKLLDEKYEILIDSEFSKGTLKIGEYTKKGKTDEIIVFVAHLDHPAMVNDDLTGVSVLVEIANSISDWDNFYTYKFLILPETIGSIAYLSQNEELIPLLKFGLFLEMLGNNNSLALQLSKEENTRLDRIAEYIMKTKLNEHREDKFRKIISNDEMVFDGPGINIPMISISRFPYPEYHTSQDNLDIVSEEKLFESKKIILNMIKILDRDYIPVRKFKGPLFLSRYGLWVDWRVNKELNLNLEQIMLRLEGNKSVFDIAEELEMDFEIVFEFLEKLFEKK